MHLLLKDTNLGSQQLISTFKSALIQTIVIILKTSFLGNKHPYRLVKSDLKFFAEYIVAHMIDHSYSKYSSLYGSGGSRGGARGAQAPPFIFRPNWGPKGQKNLFGDPLPPPPPYLKVWIRQCTGHFSWTDAFDKQHNSAVIWSTLWY